jgi:hypothetical protein
MRGQLKRKENPVYLLWSPVPRDEILKVLGGDKEDFYLTYVIGKSLAEWNLVWLFCYDAMKRYTGSARSLDNVFWGLAEDIFGAARTGAQADIKHNTSGARDMAETLKPTEFIEAFMREAYQESYTYLMCERKVDSNAAEQVFATALKNAPLLESRMLGEAEIGDDGVGRPLSEERRQILEAERQSPNVIAFPGRKR